jgi:hypothetical protein
MKTKLESKIREILWKTRAMFSISWGDSGNHKACDAETSRELLALFEAELKERDKEIDHLRIQLAGCSVAALGGTGSDSVAKKGNYGWSASYQDVLDLRIKFNELKGEGTK